MIPSPISNDKSEQKLFPVIIGYRNLSFNITSNYIFNNIIKTGLAMSRLVFWHLLHHPLKKRDQTRYKDVSDGLYLGFRLLQTFLGGYTYIYHLPIWNIDG